MNILTIASNIGRSAEQRMTQSGKAVVSFSLPMKSGYGEKERVDWVDCTIWGRQAESRLHTFLVKGTPVTVTGEASLQTYTGSDGIEKTKLCLNVRDVTLQGKKDQQSDPLVDAVKDTFPGAEVSEARSPEPLDDEIPF